MTKGGGQWDNGQHLSSKVIPQNFHEDDGDDGVDDLDGGDDDGGGDFLTNCFDPFLRYL